MCQLSPRSVLLTVWFQLDEMIEKVSYPAFILNNTFLDQFYTQVHHPLV